MKQLVKTIVLKPDMGCNLRCRYCYEFNRNGNSYQSRHYNIEHLEALIERTARLFQDSRILWMMHGGEPLINGLEYFVRFCDCIRTTNKKYHVSYRIALQTNATMLNDDWIDALEKNADLLSERIVSISIDGPKNINDLARVTADESSSFNMVMAAIDRIRKSSIDFTTITVVGSHNVDCPNEVYSFIRDLNSNFIKFIPCYNFNSDGTPEKLGITPTQYATFMCKIFDLWMNDRLTNSEGKWIVIDPIATIISNLTDTKVTWCEYRDEKCDNFTSLYPDGELWLCDTYNHDENMRSIAYIGNVNTISDDELKKALLQPNSVCAYKEFYNSTVDSCGHCDINKYCHGGCIVLRERMHAESSKMFAEYCKAKHLLIKHIERGVRLALSKS